MARLLGEVSQRRDDVAIVASSIPNATADDDRDGAPYIDFRKLVDLRKVSVLDGLEQGVVRHSPIREQVEFSKLLGRVQSGVRSRLCARAGAS